MPNKRTTKILGDRLRVVEALEMLIVLAPDQPSYDEALNHFGVDLPTLLSVFDALQSTGVAEFIVPRDMFGAGYAGIVRIKDLNRTRLRRARRRTRLKLFWARRGRKAPGTTHNQGGRLRSLLTSTWTLIVGICTIVGAVAVIVGPVTHEWDHIFSHKHSHHSGGITHGNSPGATSKSEPRRHLSPPQKLGANIPSRPPKS
jgi:hypothetical protein